jgi:hypothetical protein
MPGRNVAGTAVFFVRVSWALSVIDSSFHPFDGKCFLRLVDAGEIFD